MAALAPARRFPIDDPISPADVYLSPHFDDVCFSLGALAATRRSGRLVTVCSQSDFVERQAGLPADPQDRIEFVSAIRRDEDAQFAAGCNLTPMHLNQRDAVLRGCTPFDRPRAQEALPSFALALAGALTAPVGAAVRPWLFCPAGIGGHVDHVAVRTAVLAKRTELEQRYRIAFYEDLPYASRFRERFPGLAALRSNLGGERLRRYSIAVDIERKLRMLQVYKSQFLDAPNGLRRFTPAVLPPAPAHEAIWTSEAL